MDQVNEARIPFGASTGVPRSHAVLCPESQTPLRPSNEQSNIERIVRSSENLCLHCQTALKFALAFRVA